MDQDIPLRDEYVKTREASRLTELNDLKRRIAAEFARHAVAPDTLVVSLHYDMWPENKDAIKQWLAQRGYKDVHVEDSGLRDDANPTLQIRI